MATPDTWEFTGDTTVVVDSVRSTIPNRTLGKKVTYTLGFRPSGQSVPYDERYLAVRDYLTVADRASYGLAHEGDPWYQERLPASSPVTSLVVSIAPADPGLATAGVWEGLWGLVTGGDDTNRLSNRFQLDVEVFVLGSLGDYADRAAVAAALSNSPL